MTGGPQAGTARDRPGRRPRAPSPRRITGLQRRRQAKSDVDDLISSGSQGHGISPARAALSVDGGEGHTHVRAIRRARSRQSGIARESCRAGQTPHRRWPPGPRQANAPPRPWWDLASQAPRHQGAAPDPGLGPEGAASGACPRTVRRFSSPTLLSRGHILARPPPDCLSALARGRQLGSPEGVPGTEHTLHDGGLQGQQAAAPRAGVGGVSERGEDQRSLHRTGPRRRTVSAGAPRGPICRHAAPAGPLDPQPGAGAEGVEPIPPTAAATAFPPVFTHCQEAPGRRGRRPKLTAAPPSRTDSSRLAASRVGYTTQPASHCQPWPDESDHSWKTPYWPSRRRTITNPHVSS